MGAILRLESFDDDEGDFGATETEVTATYEEGFRDGEDAARAAMGTQQAQLSQAVVESLSDSTFGYQEAQTHFLAAMQTYVTAVLDRVLPATLSHALHVRLREVLLDALKTDASKPIVIGLPADQIDAFKVIINDLDLSHINLREDPNLTDHAAYLVNACTETSLDLDAVLAEIKHHTTILRTPSEEVS